MTCISDRPLGWVLLRAFHAIRLNQRLYVFPLGGGLLNSHLDVNFLSMLAAKNLS